MIKKIFSNLLYRKPSIYFLYHFFRPRLKGVRGGMQAVHDKHAFANNEASISVDLGCGLSPSNLFKSATCKGVDLFEDKENGVVKCNLGFERLPFDSDSLDYLTAYDLLEHIPRYADLPEHGNTPFIFLMNECYRVLKKGGIFLSSTPIFPYSAAFQDPTHNNIMTSDTLTFYFSNQKIHIAPHYGITANFKIRYQRMLGQHLVAVLEK